MRIQIQKAFLCADLCGSETLLEFLFLAVARAGAGGAKIILRPEAGAELPYLFNKYLL